jgi:hypothetical protein
VNAGLTFLAPGEVEFLRSDYAARGTVALSEAVARHESPMWVVFDANPVWFPPRKHRGILWAECRVVYGRPGIMFPFTVKISGTPEHVVDGVLRELERGYRRYCLSCRN